MNAQEKTALITKLELLLNERLTLADAIDVHDMYEVTDVDVDHDAVEVIEATFSVDFEGRGRSRVDMDSVRVEVPDSAVTICVQAAGDYVEHLLVDPELLEQALTALREPAASLSVRLRDLADEVEQMSQARIETDRKLAEYTDQVNLDGRRIAELTDSITGLRLKATEQEDQIDRLLREKATLCERIAELELRPDMPELVPMGGGKSSILPYSDVVGDVEDVSSSNINI